MGCNCKKTFKAMEKYSEDYDGKSSDDGEKLNFILTIVKFILQLGFGILVGAICIIIMPIMILYIIICMALGKSINLSLIKGLNKRNGK